MKSTDTIYDLKMKFEEEEGIVPSHQSYFCGPVPIETDDILISSLMELNGNTLDVKLRKAAMIETDQDVTIVFGPGRRRFQKIYLKPGGSKEIKLRQGKFGIVTHTEKDGEDNVYTVERYKLSNEEEQTIVLKSVDSHTVVFLVTSGGQEERLTPEVMEYKMGKTTMDRVIEISKIGANIGRIISAIDSVVNWGKYQRQERRKLYFFSFSDSLMAGKNLELAYQDDFASPHL